LSGIITPLVIGSAIAGVLAAAAYALWPDLRRWRHDRALRRMSDVEVARQWAGIGEWWEAEPETDPEPERR
jgi:hypothetical protein